MKFQISNKGRTKRYGKGKGLRIMIKSLHAYRFHGEFELNVNFGLKWKFPQRLLTQRLPMKIVNIYVIRNSASISNDVKYDNKDTLIPHLAKNFDNFQLVKVILS